jgi:hypothetical protein
MILIQAIRNAMVIDLVARNVAEQALAVLDAARGERLWPYVAVSMLGGIRTEEARACAAIALGPLFESRGKTNGGQS